MNKNKIKKLEEKELLEKFVATDVWKIFVKNLGIIDYEKAESPDFIIKTKNGEKIALEMTKFIIENKNLKFSQALTRIGNKLCREAENKYNVHFHIIINKCDKRKFSIHWKDQLDYACNPGFAELPDLKIFKQKLQDVLKNNIENFKDGRLAQEWIQVGNDYFNISIDPIVSPWTGKYDCHVNNAGMIKQNPIDELQICINKKNDKIQAYSKNCTMCYLLIIVPSAYKTNYCLFDEKLFKHKFDSKFEKIFLYSEESENSYILKH